MIFCFPVSSIVVSPFILGGVIVSVSLTIVIPVIHTSVANYLSKHAQWLWILGWSHGSFKTWLKMQKVSHLFKAVIYYFPLHKSPGPEGFPIEHYKTYAEVFVHHLHFLNEFCLDQKTFPKFMLDVPMILLPKPGKDPIDCYSSRSIALLNLKILTKILATRLAKVNSALVSINQRGFMPGKWTDSNLHWVFTCLQIVQDDSSTIAFVSIDKEKAFDSIDWEYMLRVLEEMGFGPKCWLWVREPGLSFKLIFTFLVIFQLLRLEDQLV